jgi:hypothetical protein
MVGATGPLRRQATTLQWGRDMRHNSTPHKRFSAIVLEFGGGIIAQTIRFKSAIDAQASGRAEAKRQLKLGWKDLELITLEGKESIQGERIRAAADPVNPPAVLLDVDTNEDGREVGLVYCPGCKAEVWADSTGQDTFYCYESGDEIKARRAEVTRG